MSNLAQSIVTILRDDKDLSDLLYEHELLRKQWKASRAVTVTGPEGTPVYATGQFDEGKYANNPNLWEVTLQQLEPCPLAVLKNIEIQCGGIFKADFSPNAVSVHGFVDDPELKDGWGDVNFCFPEGQGGLWLDARVGAPLSLGVFLDVATNSDNVHLFLSDNVADRHPHLTVQFDHISFFPNEVKMAVQSLPLDPAMVRDAQIRLRELEEFMRESREAAQAEEAMEVEGDGLWRLVNNMPEEMAREILAMPETHPVDLDAGARAVLRRMLRDRFEVNNGEMNANEENEDVDDPS